MFLSNVSIKRPVFATMMMVALVVLGIVSYDRLAIDEYPDITYPIVIAQTTYPGASPEVMERDVSRPIEEALNTVQGLKEIGSTSLNGVSLVRLTFNLNVDVLAAQQDVQAKVARIRRTLPKDIEEPVINHFESFADIAQQVHGGDLFEGGAVLFGHGDEVPLYRSLTMNDKRKGAAE